MKFNKRYNAYNHFVFKNNELYRQVFKVRQPKRLVVCDYNSMDIIEKVHI